MGHLRSLVEAASQGKEVPLLVLGRGNYSIIYRLSPSLVLKVALNDDCYYQYVRGIIEDGLAGNPYVPRVFATYHKYGARDVYLLERLRRPNGRTEWNTVRRLTEIADEITLGPEEGVLSNCQNSEERVIMEWLSLHSLCNDFHDQNIMFRGNQPVIIDPAS